MPMTRSLSYRDEVTRLFIQRSLLISFHYKNLHLVLFQVNASLDSQITTWSYHYFILYSQIWPSFYIGSLHLKPSHSYIFTSPTDLTIGVCKANSTPTKGSHVQPFILVYRKHNLCRCERSWNLLTILEVHFWSQQELCSLENLFHHFMHESTTAMHFYSRIRRHFSRVDSRACQISIRFLTLLG